MAEKAKVEYVKVTFQLSKEQHEILRRVSFENRVSISAILRDMVENNLDDWEKSYKSQQEKE